MYSGLLEATEGYGGVRSCYERGKDQGRFIHGSFGSGKSHFLPMLWLLLEANDFARQKQDEVISTLARTHLAWLREARFLVVRVHMLTGSQGSRLDRTLYEATNRTLEPHGKEPFHFLNVDGVINEARDEARRHGHAFWKQMEEAGIVGGAEDFEALASGSMEERERLALEYLRFKNHDPATAGLNPNWTARRNARRRSAGTARVRYSPNAGASGRRARATAIRLGGPVVSRPTVQIASTSAFGAIHSGTPWA